MKTLMERLKDDYREKIFSEYNKNNYPNVLDGIEKELNDNIAASKLAFGTVSNIVCFLSIDIDGSKSLINCSKTNVLDIYNFFKE